jgi:RNA polymerase sigma factor for flagellar operon FliA
MPEDTTHRHERHAHYRRFVGIVEQAATHAAARFPSTSYSELSAWAWLGVIESFERRVGELAPEDVVDYTRWRVDGAIFDAIAARDPEARELRALSSRITVAIRTLSEILSRPPEAAEIARELGMSDDDYGDSLLDLAARGMTRLEMLREPPALARGERVHSVASTDRDPDIHSALHEALAALPDRTRALFDLHYGECLPLAVAGRRLGIDEPDAVALHAEAIHRLRAAIGRD